MNNDNSNNPDKKNGAELQPSKNVAERKLPTIPLSRSNTSDIKGQVILNLSLPGYDDVQVLLACAMVYEELRYFVAVPANDANDKWQASQYMTDVDAVDTELEQVLTDLYRDVPQELKNMLSIEVYGSEVLYPKLFAKLGEISLLLEPKTDHVGEIQLAGRVLH
jgi:hypothetical protein